MNTSTLESPHAAPTVLANARIDSLDATRAFALLLGIVFHASLSFLPTFIGWAVQDVSTSVFVGIFALVSHSFRMETFFLLAGFFGHMSFHRKGAGGFLRTRALRILVPFVVGWFILRPLLVSGWIMGSASLRGDYDFWDGIKAGVRSLSSLPDGIFTGSHLWFLYYLALVSALVIGARALLTAHRSGHATLARAADAVASWLAQSRWALPALAIPTATVLWFMSNWSMDTPDRALRPHIPVLIVYTSFFALGWIWHRQIEQITVFARLSWDRWVTAAVGIGGVLLLAGIERNPAHPHFVAAHAGYALCYALMMWSLVTLTIGVFQKLCVRPSPAVRYLADSSYWMYLIHLPIVVWLQVAVAEWALHWTLKLGLISVATVAVALLTYDLFVRSTVIGVVLNGRRRARAIFRW